MYPHPRWPETAYFAACAGGGALIALAARLAGRRRWVVGIPLLVALGFAGLCLYGLLLLGPGSAPGLGLGILLGVLVLGPGILAIPYSVSSAREPSSSSAPASQNLLSGERRFWVGVIGALIVPLLSFWGPPAVRGWQLEETRRDMLAAVEDLARTDILVRLGPVEWHNGEYGLWPDSPDFVAQGLASETNVSLYLRSPQLTREFGRRERAEGLRAGWLYLSVPQPRFLSSAEMGDLQIVKTFLLSMGLRPELVSRLSPRMTATYRGVTYLFRLNTSLPSSGGEGGYPPYLPRPREWCPTGKAIVIECRGVRSAASP